MNVTISLLTAGLLLFSSSIATAGGGCPKSRGSNHRGFGGARVGITGLPAAIYAPAPRITARSIPRNTIARQPVSPVTQSTTQPVALAEPTPSTADRVSLAMEAFRLGNHHQARLLADRLLEEVPTSADLLQFRSLVHLRDGNLKESALDIYQAVQHGAIWSLEQVRAIYGDLERYENDARMLRLLAQSDPQDLAAHFLSAYHHLVAGELAPGRKSLEQVLVIQPEEPIAVALMRLIETQSGKSPVASVAKTVN